MRTPIQLRLTLIMLAVLLFAMSLTIILTWLAVERLYLDTQRENLLAQALLTASTLQWDALPVAPIEPYSQTSNVTPGVHTRLLGEQGAILLTLPIPGEGTSLQEPLAENAASIPPDELLQRPEIQSALAGDPVTAVRRVESADNRRVLYAAAPVFAQDFSVVGIVYLATPLPPARLPAAVIWQLSGAVLIAMLLAGAAGAILSRRFAHPLEKLADAAAAIAEGDLDQHVPVESSILELHRLGVAFNNMTNNLRHSNQAKNAFIADVTHELRTPLTVINGTIETLEDGAIDDIEGRGRLLASMGAEAGRLIRLVNDLLVLTRADAGALNLQLELIDLEEFGRFHCERLSALAQPRCVKLALDAATPAWVVGDADRLTQVLDNLLDNAIRHSPDDSTIMVAVAPEGDWVRCAVTDQGAGIPPQHLPFIFERFYRVENSRKRHSGGAGLGLAIVHSLVTAMGGRVAVESIEGQGTTVTFWLLAHEN